MQIKHLTLIAAATHSHSVPPFHHFRQQHDVSDGWRPVKNSGGISHQVSYRQAVVKTARSDFANKKATSIDIAVRSMRHFLRGQHWRGGAEDTIPTNCRDHRRDSSNAIANFNNTHAIVLSCAMNEYPDYGFTHGREIIHFKPFIGNVL